MARRSIRRRRALIGISTLVLGASGFVASGAFSTGSQGSLGDNWIQVAGTNQGITFESPQQVNVQDSAEGQEGGEESGEEDSEGDAGGDDGNAGDDGDTSDTGGGDTSDTGGGDTGDTGDDGDNDSDNQLTSQLEVIVDPAENNIVDPSGTPLADGALLPWTGSIHQTSLTRGTENGLLLGIASDKVNNEAVTQYGTFDSTAPGDDVVFIIANGGSADSDISLPPVDITMRLYAGDDRRINSNQIRFPYRVLDLDRNVIATGDDLTDPSEGSIELATGEIIEVIIEFDTTESSADLKILSEIRFFANGGSN